MSELHSTGAVSQLTQDDVLSFHTLFQREPKNLQARNAACVTPINKLLLNRDIVTETGSSFSHHLPENKVTSQSASGRCWLFAAQNILRYHAIRQLNLGEDFELSNNFLMFWDKLERANYFLESILETLDEPVDGRLLYHLLGDPIQDGGQWNMLVNIIKKYGVVPKSVMPETESSGNTFRMNSILKGKLREDAFLLREGYSQGHSINSLRKKKFEMLSEIYCILAIHLGEPPSKFFWQWRDKDKDFHRDGLITPQEFYKKYIGVDLNEYVCLIHCPQKSKAFNEVYTVKFLGNVVGGEIVRYLNLDLDIIKKAAVQQLLSGEAVWFGCDVGQSFDRDLGMWDPRLLTYKLFYGTTVELNKAQRLDYGHSKMTHAMIFTGVDLDESEQPRKWRVENSWGDKVGDKGFMIMTDSWFDEYCYEIVVHRRFLRSDILDLLKKTPIPLEPWDPMGALA